MEPIPAIDTFVESDWRVKSEDLNGVKAVRVLSGYESPDGTLDAQRARGYWFDGTGELVKTYFSGVETRRLDFQNFGEIKVARTIDVLMGGKLAMMIQVSDLSPAPAITEGIFTVKGHSWTRAFTDEVR
jgi:hypothetical protein